MLWFWRHFRPELFPLHSSFPAISFTPVVPPRSFFRRTTGSSRPHVYSYNRWPMCVSWQIDRPTQHLQPTQTKILNRAIDRQTDRPTPTGPEVVSVGGLSTCNSIIYSQSPASKSVKPFLLAGVGKKKRERENQDAFPYFKPALHVIGMGKLYSLPSTSLLSNHFHTQTPTPRIGYPMKIDTKVTTVPTT